MKIANRIWAGVIASGAIVFLPASAGKSVPLGQVSTPGQVVHEVGVTNVEVPVRVFKGDAFVDSLQKDDFEVLEDGVPQEIDAVYLIRKTSVARNEGASVSGLRTGRLFVLLFEMSDYQAEIGRAMDYFFDQVIEAQDELILMTPMNTYNLKPGMLLKTSRAKIKDELLAKVRAGITLGSAEYRALMRELVSVMSSDGFLDQKLLLYGETMKRLESLRSVDQRKLVEFARFLKSREGQKHVFFFYQKELVPKVNAKEISLLIEANQERPDLMFDMMEKFEFYNRYVTFDVRAVQESFSDSSIAVHFLFLTKTSFPSIEFGVGSGTALKESSESIAASGATAGGGGGSFLTFEEQSEDIFSAFAEIARATGGLVDSSAAADQSFKRAAEATENYYLLYYRPSNTKTDKTFRKIVVRVKDGGYRVTHRQGYIAG